MDSLKLPSDDLGSGLRVAHEHSWVAVTADGGDFRPLLEETTDGLVT
jgi:hypothetical protein